MDLSRYDGHSPAPWHVGDHGEHVYCAENYAVADCCRGSRKEGRANAKLVADAPALLAELRRVTAERDKLREELRGLRDAAELVVASKYMTEEESQAYIARTVTNPEG